MQEHGAMLGPLRTAAAHPAQVGGTPLDHTREVPAIRRLERSGYGAEFVAEPGGTLRVSGTDRRYTPDQLRIHDFYRFEGTSDPDDMSVIYAIETRDGTRGVLVDAFGTYASPVVTAVLDRVALKPLAIRPLAA